MAAAEGNQYASKAKLWTEAIYKALERRAEGEKRPRVEILADYADKLLDAAGEGDLQALQELGNRVEGRPTQRVETDSTLEITVRFQRDAEMWAAIEHEVTPILAAKVAALPEGAQDTMRLVLEDVPTAQQSRVYEQAVGIAVAAAGRDAEIPTELLERQTLDVVEAAVGYGADLGVETEEERATFADAAAKVAAHNAQVRARRG